MTHLTETEAKTKWCPLVRYLATFRDGNDKLETAGCFNRAAADSGLSKAHCIASACMAWRSVDVANADATAMVTKGYCGAFGNPSDAA